jgi:hypothetical protein
MQKMVIIIVGLQELLESVAARARPGKLEDGSRR